ncbi:MAG: error-prone DNA polymerase [bacterium]
MDYAELHCHSAFSLQEGASLPERLLDRAAALGLKALALTDHDDMGGVVRFGHHAREIGDFPAILGLELTLGGALVASDQAPEVHHLTLLARDKEGYANLCRLVTLARGGEHAVSPVTRGRVRIQVETLAAHRAGVLCLSGCPRGYVPTLLRGGDPLGARRSAGLLKDIFGEHFAVEVWDHGLSEEAAMVGGLLRIADEVGAPWVVTNNVHYAEPEERVLHDVLTCLKEGVTLDEAGRRLRPNAEWHLKGPRAMAQRWRHEPAGLRASVALAERCAFRLQDLKPALPGLRLPDGIDNNDAYLRRLAYEGAAVRWAGCFTEQHRRQLDHELGIVARKGLAGFFLIMWEIVGFARACDPPILVQGRGSSANSAVCYCLGITAVDPIKFHLLFERFLSEEREGYPDIDLDIEHRRREEVIQWVYRRYGRRHAAMVCEHICWRGRSAVRDTARVLGFSTDEGARLAEQVGRFNGPLTPDAIQAAGFDPTAPRLKALHWVVERLYGIPRHRSIHVGGFVLSTQPVGEIVPVEQAAMDGRTIIQWDKDDLDSAGLPKFDLLGLGMLTALAEGLRLAGAARGLAEAVPLYSLQEEPAVYAQIGEADTVGVFQIESRAQMNTLPRTRPENFYELAIQVALIRPGPLQGDMVHPYIRRKRGEEVWELPHPKLAPILGRTLGVPLFQEQSMQVAVEAAGFTASQADSLRRAMGGERHRHKLSDLNEKLRTGMLANGISSAEAELIIKRINAFSSFGFPESHSTSFALLVYASAWLKHHHPAEFLCSLLNAQPMGFYSASSLIHDAKRHGVEVRPPCLAQSDWDSLMEAGAVRLGLRLVVGLGAAARQALKSARAAGPFTSALDAVRRVALPARSWGVLAEAGAFSAWLPARRDAIWEVLRLSKSALDGLPLAPAPEGQATFPAMSPAAETAADYRTLGATAKTHPVVHLRPWLAARGVVPAGEVARVPNGGWLTVAGLVIARQRPESAKGFFFMTLEDETGFVNIIVRPKDFDRNRQLLSRSAILGIAGLASHEQGAHTVQGRRFFAVDPGELAPPRSHDFH